MSSSSSPGAGFEYPTYEVSWLKRDALLFANSIGCKADELQFLYELHPSFQTFPTYPIILPFKHTDTEVVDFYARSAASPIPGVPALDHKRVVDGERRMQFLRPIPPSSSGKKFIIKSKVIGVYDKGNPGTVVETQNDLVEVTSSGQEIVYTRMTGVGFFVKQGNWGGPKGPSTENFPPPKGKEGKPDVTYIQETNEESALLYRLNGDYNPLHATPEPGSKMGFGGTIMHGLFSWNGACHAILRELGGSEAGNLREFRARFASPVRPGDTLVSEIWRIEGTRDGEGFEEVRFLTKVKESGKVVLSNGRARVRVVGRRENRDCSVGAGGGSKL